MKKEEYQDYSMMFSRIEHWSKEKLKTERNRYMTKARKMNATRLDYSNTVNILNTNAEYFNERIREIEYQETRVNFVLTEEHLLLLRNLNIDHHEGYLFTNNKRPLGYSYEIEGVVRALGLDLDHCDLPEEEEDRLWRLVKELPLAFEYLVNLSFQSLTQAQ